MHEFVAQDREALNDIAAWTAARLSDPSAVPAYGRAGEPGTGAEPLPALASEGIGTDAAWAWVRDAVLPTAFATDHPRYLAFVGGAPTPAAVLTDAALSAASVYGGSELEAGTVVTAERAALGWLCAFLGYPAEAHGAFVSGGSLANLSALVAARHGRRTAAGAPPGVIVMSASAHASVRAAAAIMGCEVVPAGTADGRLRAADLAPVLDAHDPDDVVAVVASAGATNTGAVDALAEIAALCAEREVWLHVDAAYGGAAMLSPCHREAFAGIERADSITIDPHKWLFTPYECAAILYRDPHRARAAHRQRAEYLEAAHEAADNPADYAVHLTRRARGLPLWASLLANGTDAYVDAVEQCLTTAGYAAKQIEASPTLELATAPQLSVVLFRRTGWGAAEYEQWSQAARRSGLGLVTPTTFGDEPVLRLCFVNPRTTATDVDLLLMSLKDDLP
ncbi:aminotransferase class I/II-fold pyridoxal phosphate-dependent enzyme [Nocardioides sp. BP30]|uniref:pyridoxal phosphate-dependent decarboxylase family protein n=1 Tax=Nocardioides sp. BP30 TaxID=3036374 RepID=UPI002468AAE1|nr:aminotransferase class I/II-fold pyridoxal phosphate-dependent enzyme [Nocardioides sp. BP30]WGL51377.1 aminotransferase class I/II-fold pyridoxal phosphate-dependent enzyme [Nocardioides sp. BP30]